VRLTSTHLSILIYEFSRTEFTKDDDEQLCVYIAEVLPDIGEGGRTGHFIYADLMRRVGTSYSEFSEFSIPLRQMNSVNTNGRIVTLKMDGASAIARIGIAWTRGSPRLLRKTHLHSTGKVDICTEDMGGLTKMMS